MKAMNHKVAGCALVALLLTLTRVAWAAVVTNYWLPAGGGILGDAANWSLGEPVAEQILAVTNQTSYAVTNATAYSRSTALHFTGSGSTVTYVGTASRSQKGIVISAPSGGTAALEQVTGSISMSSGGGAIAVGQDWGQGRFVMRGPQTRISTYYAVYVGDSSSNNVMEVTDGAYLYKRSNGTYICVGRGAGSQGNRLVISNGGGDYQLRLF